MLGFLKSKHEDEESVTWSPPDQTTDVTDELALCNACQFKGHCQFKSGCRSFQQARRNREKLSVQIRGEIASKSEGEVRLNYLHGVSWKDRLGRDENAYAKIIHVDGPIATVAVTIKGSTDREDRGTRTEFSVRIPVVSDGMRHAVANIQMLRSEVRKKINEFIR